MHWNVLMSLSPRQGSDVVFLTLLSWQKRLVLLFTLTLIFSLKQLAIVVGRDEGRILRGLEALALFFLGA